MKAERRSANRGGGLPPIAEGAAAIAVPLDIVRTCREAGNAEYLGQVLFAAYERLALGHPCARPQGIGERYVLDCVLSANGGVGGFRGWLGRGVSGGRGRRVRNRAEGVAAEAAGGLPVPCEAGAEGEEVLL